MQLTLSLQAENLLQGPACYDALSAKLVEQAGGPHVLHDLQHLLLKLILLGDLQASPLHLAAALASLLPGLACLMPD